MVFSYIRGADQSTFNVDPTANYVDVSAIRPGKDREFLEGTLHFGVLDDHLMVMQSWAASVNLCRRLTELFNLKAWRLSRPPMVQPTSIRYEFRPPRHV